MRQQASARMPWQFDVQFPSVDLSFKALYEGTENVLFASASLFCMLSLSAAVYLALFIPITQWLASPETPLPMVQLSMQQIPSLPLVPSRDITHSSIQVASVKGDTSEVLQSVAVNAWIGQNMLSGIPVIGQPLGLGIGAWLGYQNSH